ncbi:hypothetical protein B7463_g4567, partial [Scytalidium lignicola]
MARQRNQKKEKPNYKLAQPDRSTDPSRETLLELAEKHGLFKVNDDGPGKKNGSQDRPVSEEEVTIGRLAESILWSISLTMLHFTVDFLVHHQYAMSLSWSNLATRSVQAFPSNELPVSPSTLTPANGTGTVIWLLFYTFHPHPNPSIFVSAPLSKRIPPILHQLFFLVVSVVSGCYMIYTTNENGYLANMKRAPPLGCMWIWAVIELDLLWAAISLLACVGFLKLGGYSIT